MMNIIAWYGLVAYIIGLLVYICALIVSKDYKEKFKSLVNIIFCLPILYFFIEYLIN